MDARLREYALELISSRFFGNAEVFSDGLEGCAGGNPRRQRASAAVKPDEDRNAISGGTQRLSGSIRTAIAWLSANALAQTEDSLSKYTKSGRLPSLCSRIGAAANAAPRAFNSS